MNLVDSSGWLEYFANGPQAHAFAKVIEDTKHVLVPSICIYEVFKKAMQFTDEKKALDTVAVMRTGKVVPLDEHIAFAAAIISHKLKLPMADSIILATAQEHKAAVWTMDADFEGLPGVHFIAKK